MIYLTELYYFFDQPKTLDFKKAVSVPRKPDIITRALPKLGIESEAKTFYTPRRWEARKKNAFFSVIGDHTL